MILAISECIIIKTLKIISISLYTNSEHLSELLVLGIEFRKVSTLHLSQVQYNLR